MVDTPGMSKPKPIHSGRDVDADLRLMAIALLAKAEGAFPWKIRASDMVYDMADAIGLDLPPVTDDFEYVWALLEHLPTFMIVELRKAWT